jgi:hypothetical protein
VNDDIDAVREDVRRLIGRLDDLVIDTVRAQLRGEDAKATEKRLSRARNALRRAYGVLGSLDPDGDDLY